MKLDALIAQLTDIKNVHGNMPVYLVLGDMQYDPGILLQKWGQSQWVEISRYQTQTSALGVSVSDAIVTEVRFG